jgi:hypothetical protein
MILDPAASMVLRRGRAGRIGADLGVVMIGQASKVLRSQDQLPFGQGNSQNGRAVTPPASMAITQHP